MVRELSEAELQLIGGGDAAATREKGKNSWNEEPGESTGVTDLVGCLFFPGACEA